MMQDNQMDCVLETKNLSVFYGEHEAVKNISIKIPENKIIALVGPSGCGKSTFLKSLNLMHDTAEGRRVTGEIMYQGININQRAINQYVLRKKIGMVFQKPNPFKMSIQKNITFPLERHGLHDKEKLQEIVQDVLIKVGLWEEVKDKLSESALSLSGGQQQRLCIARVLAMEPDIILMDEPTSALDPISTKTIEMTLDSLKKQYTIVMVTHNLAQAARLSDYTAFFSYGELIEYNPTSKVFTDPDKELTNDYITGDFG